MLRGELLVDVYMLRDLEELPHSLSQFNEDVLRPYFTHGGWRGFMSLVCLLRSQKAA